MRRDSLMLKVRVYNFAYEVLAAIAEPLVELAQTAAFRAYRAADALAQIDEQAAQKLREELP